jgi:TetR/AcrR family transcriptional regulator, regulator of autoinduction and epiphytic fitness
VHFLADRWEDAVVSGRTGGGEVSQGAEVRPIDGRAARTQRTRAAIVAAHADLIGEGDLRPTGERIAARAGVSTRALWLHFAEMEALFEATAAEVLRRQDLAFRPVDPDLSLTDRIDQFCRQRATLLESIAPFARASQLREPYSPALRAYHRRHVGRVVDEIRVLFADELRRAAPTARDRVVAALAAAATWGSWSVLRDDLGLGLHRARAVMIHTVTSLLDRPPKENR